MARQVQFRAVRAVSLLAVLLVGGGQAQAADVAQPLTAAEIRATLIGNTVQNIVQGVPATTYFDPDGTKRFHSMRMNDSGTYRIEPDGKLCGRWHFLRGGTETCGFVYRDGARFNGRTDGAEATAFTIRPGRPE